MSVLCRLEDFYLSFEGQKFIFGLSFEGRPLYGFKVCKTAYPVVIAQYAIHAREYITTLLALEQIRDFATNGRCGTVYFIPAMNPDGIVIASNNNPLYKANANGVDLNINFDARWGLGEKNIRVKGAENFIGERPFSEPETRALRDFTLKVKPNLTLSYHSKGEEIYYSSLRQDLAKKLEKATGYKLRTTPNSAGGYKDWCVERLNIPAFTIEVGGDELVHPIKEEQLEQIYQKNKDVINVITENIQWETLKNI